METRREMNKIGNYYVILMDCEKRNGEGIIYSLYNKGFNVAALSKKKRYPAIYSKCIAKYYQSPSLGDGFEQYLDFLKTLPIRGPVIPSGDLSAQFMSEYKNTLSENGFFVNSVDIDTLLQVFDKSKCHQLCEKLNIPVAKTISVDSIEEIMQCHNKIKFPAILKPTKMAGGNYIRVFSLDEAIHAFNKLNSQLKKESYEIYKSGMIYQEWIDSRMEDNWICDVFYDKNSMLRSCITIKKIRSSLNSEGTPTSRLYAGMVLENQDIKEYTQKILESVNWRGLAHVEFIWDRSQEKFLLTEVNPRLPGFSYLLSRTGYEFGYFYAADLLDVNYIVPYDPPKVKYFETLRYPGDISDGVIYALRGHISFRSLFKSYIKAILSKEAIVIDHLNVYDIRMTIAILLNNLFQFIKESKKYIKKHIRITNE